MLVYYKFEQVVKMKTKYRPLPEAVPLTMSINEKAFVMGENLKVNINVDADADGNEMVANEDFDIYFTAKAGTEDDIGCILNHLAVLLQFSKRRKTNSGGFFQ